MSKKITELTSAQRAQVAVYRDRYWRQAISTEPADRPRAEAAARRLAEIGGVNISRIVWVESPLAGSEQYGAAWASLSDSLWASLSDSLWDSLWASLRDQPWLCWCTYAVEVLEIDCSDEHFELLRLHNEIAASCFALWIVPGTVILCERPSEVEIKGNKLVGLSWREKGGGDE